MAGLAKGLGAGPELLQTIVAANTSIEVLKLCQQQGLDLARAVCEKALAKARSVVPDSVQIEVWAIDRQGVFVGRAGAIDHSRGQS